MTTIEHRVIIHRPIADVFAFVNDFAAYPLWQQNVIEARIVSKGPLGMNAEIMETRRYADQETHLRWRVTGFDPPYRRAFEILDGPTMGAHGEMTLISLLPRALNWRCASRFPHYPKRCCRP